MAEWSEFAGAMLVFIGSHALTARPAWKSALVARLGHAGFGLLYSALSIGLLAWVIVAAGRAPFVPLWPPGRWQVWLALGLMLAASLLGAGALGGVNPLSFGSRGAPFDPEHPGIAGIHRHPLLLALALWALAHLIANGDLAHVLLFGPMGVFALLGMAAIDRRKRRTLPDWHRLARNTSLIPLAPLLTGRWRPGRFALPEAVAGVLVWALLLWLHPMVIGPDPLAGL
ncbi:MAG: NnrU family protein [Rhodobacter sp.]|uniref:NnrU family protein n=1 Tax=Pararhodobacter sp. TaxID=2127056 RepID=UPI001D8B31E3|nr:NnrU family protein [Pararhodobacter sp.]MCB1346872.1 NnrU family protein [Paracoccaceae bacterium]MCC0072555.1 NnrU family protein [Rhodobacter sp.]HPD93627.1 NnrU family protein [Pararhodobacter sp.]